MKRVIFLLLGMMFSSAAMAAEWAADKENNYSLVAGGQALSVECQASKNGEVVSFTPVLRYWPSCGIGCKDTSLDDVSKRATLLVDSYAFSVKVTGDAEAIVVQTPELPQLFGVLAQAKFISIHSSQITPRYSAFPDIGNAAVLAGFYESCLGRKQ